MNYLVEIPLSIICEKIPDLKKQDLSLSEKNDYRIIGGDLHDLHFQGFTYNHETKEAFLKNPILTRVKDKTYLDEEEVFQLAQNVLLESFDSIGIECLY